MTAHAPAYLAVAVSAFVLGALLGLTVLDGSQAILNSTILLALFILAAWQVWGHGRDMLRLRRSNHALVTSLQEIANNLGQRPCIIQPETLDGLKQAIQRDLVDLKTGGDR